MLRLIAVFKFCKAALLVTVGLGALELLQPNVAARAQRWVDALAATSDRRLIQRLISWASGLDPRGLELVAIGALLYATLFTIEGTGLWLGKRWAEYLTVIASLMFVPVEITRLIRHATPSLFAALTLNLAIAGYLLWRLRETPPLAPAADARPRSEGPSAPVELPARSWNAPLVYRGRSGCPPTAAPSPSQPRTVPRILREASSVEGN